MSAMRSKALRPKRRGFRRLTSWVGIRQLLENLRGSYWFVPSLMAVGAVALAVASIAIDRALPPDWLGELRLIGPNGPEGARAVLTTVAASMIGVAGVTFSITIAAVAYSASQFAPRLLTNFMRDRGNQITLGTYVAAFLYCLVVLRAVNDSWGPGSGEAAEPFVPQVATLMALGLAIAGCAVLIYYIHHIPQSIHISRVIARIGDALDDRIEAFFPAERRDVPEPPPLATGALEVRAEKQGYIQRIDLGHLLECAERADARIDLVHAPGEFVARGRVLARVAARGVDEEALADSIRSAFATGVLRTPREDVLFLVNELLEIATRALSPGVNDPFTAISCVDRIGAALSALARRGDVHGVTRDADGAVRVVARPLTFEIFVAESLERLRPYAVKDRNVSLHLASTLAELAAELDDPSRRRALRGEVHALREEAAPHLAGADRDRLERRTRAALERLGPRPIALEAC